MEKTTSMNSKHTVSGSSAERLHFTGTNVVILNAQNDLGHALLKLFLSQGANVVANVTGGVQNVSPLPPQGKLLARFTTLATDSSLIEAAVSEFGTVQVLVNLVDVAPASITDDSAGEKWQSSVQGPLKAAYKASQVVWPHFREQNFGKILHVCSRSDGGNAYYSALKFALLGLTKTSALEGKKYNISTCLVTDSPPNLLYAHERRQGPFEIPSLHALVNTISILGLSKNESESGTLFEVSGSKVTAARWARSAGALLKPDTTFNPSSVRQKWNDIVDLSKPSYSSGPVDPSDVLANLPNLGPNKSGQHVGFDDQVVVVTGAGGGLGRAHARLFAKLGAAVVVNDLKGAEIVVDEIRAQGGKAVAHVGSATDGGKIVAKAIEAFGRIDVIVNNAGILRDRTLAKMEEASWVTVLDVHLDGMFNLAKAAWPHFVRQKSGRLINTASTSGIYGFFGQSNYSAAKLGIVGLADALARDGARHNIVVNTIAPIAATSTLAGNIKTMPGEEPNVLKPEYISPLVVLLGSSQAKFLATGGLFELAGGWHSRTVLQRSKGVHASGTIEALLTDWPDVLSFNPGPIQSVPVLPKNLLENKEGRRWERPTFRYDDRDIILYNLSVGAKRADLDLIYENLPAFQPVPVFGLIPAVDSDLIYNNQNLVPNFSDRRALHGEHYLEIVKHPIPSKGAWNTSVEVLDVIDKGNAAITITGLTTRDKVTNEMVYYNEVTFFLRESGGFGGPRTRQSLVRGPPLSTPPKRPADKSIEHQTSEEQAALYRLTGDRVSMHIDPSESSKAGFPNPILRGACFLGITGYYILRTYGRYRSIRNRFSGVVIPGQTLRVEMWREAAKDGADLVCFQTTVVETGKRCIEGGVAVLVEGPGQKL
ncbi:hypothetical protein LTR84_008822 [Exophiala bonariae]|uniref:Ketoreductase domain-containing protein n=1 Tax=Exophiala bonariae TaxID=1690606 RepID=A0AAV9MX56_9EURO|nr:hypothetical protein LTR84_008822 [Exophiala bonariae]